MSDERERENRVRNWSGMDAAHPRVLRVSFRNRGETHADKDVGIRRGQEVKGLETSRCDRKSKQSVGFAKALEKRSGPRNILRSISRSTFKTDSKTNLPGTREGTPDILPDAVRDLSEPQFLTHGSNTFQTEFL